MIEHIPDGVYGLVYKIIHLESGKTYVGKTTRISTFYYYWGSGKYIKRAIQLYGQEAFKKEVLSFCLSEKELNEKEVQYIQENQSRYPQGYNLTPGGDGKPGWSASLRKPKMFMSGGGPNRPWTEEDKKRLSDFQTVRMKDPQRREHLSKVLKERAQAGKTISEEGRRKISEKAKERWAQYHKDVVPQKRKKRSSTEKTVDRFISYGWNVSIT